MFFHNTSRQGIREYIVTLAVVILITGAINAYAQDQHFMSLEDLTKTADFVLIGDCTNVRSFWNSSHTMIFTEIEHNAIADDFILKGSVQSGTYSFIQPGGQVDNIKTIVPDQPSFTIGDRSLLFLYRADRIILSGTVDASFGKVPIHRDPKKEMEFVVLWTLPPDTITFYPAAPSPEAQRVNLPIQELKSLIDSWAQENNN